MKLYIDNCKEKEEALQRVNKNIAHIVLLSENNRIIGSLENQSFLPTQTILNVCWLFESEKGGMILWKDANEEALKAWGTLGSSECNNGSSSPYTIFPFIITNIYPYQTNVQNMNIFNAIFSLKEDIELWKNGKWEKWDKNSVWYSIGVHTILPIMSKEEASHRGYSSSVNKIIKAWGNKDYCVIISDGQYSRTKQVSIMKGVVMDFINITPTNLPIELEMFVDTRCRDRFMDYRIGIEISSLVPIGITKIPVNGRSFIL